MVTLHNSGFSEMVNLLSSSLHLVALKHLGKNFTIFNKRLAEELN